MSGCIGFGVMHMLFVARVQCCDSELL